MGDFDQARKTSAMRPAIFVSLAFASAFAAYSASACDTRADYSNKIDKVQMEYRVAVDTANKAYGEKTAYSVRPAGANLVDWQNAVGARQAQETYDNYINNACSWWW
jgi:hypothetical protein